MSMIGTCVMGPRWLSEKLTKAFIRDGFLCLVFVALLPASELQDQSGSGRPVWTVEHNRDQNLDELTLKVGSNLSLSCVVDALDLQYEVLRVSLVQGDVFLPLFENGRVHSSFSGIHRYSAQLVDQPGNGVSMTIFVNDIRPEDTGSYVCHKHLERDNSASLNLTVLVPVTDLYVTSMYPDGDEVRVEDDGEVVLQEHDFYGVGCIATVEGSYIAPSVLILIDGKDVTESFQSVPQLDYSVLHSGLTLWNSRRRLTFTSASPNPDFNEKQLRCVARQNGFPDVEATAQLFVQFAPLILCSQERIIARIGTSATFECNIRANPGSRITWSSSRGDLSNYPNVFFDETIISSDQTRLRLSIQNVKQINYQRYTLTAANIIDSTRVTFELLEDPTVLAERHREVESAKPEVETVGPEILDAVLSEDVHLPDERPAAAPEVAKPAVFPPNASTIDGGVVPEIQNESPGNEGEEQIIEDPEQERGHHPEHEHAHIIASETEEISDDDLPKAAVGSSSFKVGEPSDEADSPAQPAGVQYSHSQSSLSSNGRDSKSDKSNPKTSSAKTLPASILLAVSVVIGRL